MLDPLLLLDRPQPLDPLQLLDRHQRLDVQLLLLGRPQPLDPLLLLGPQVCRLLRRIPGYALLPQSAPVLLWSCSGYLSCGPPTGAAPDKPPDPGRPSSAGLSSEQVSGCALGWGDHRTVDVAKRPGFGESDLAWGASGHWN